MAPRAYWKGSSAYLDKPYCIVPNGKAGADAFVMIRDAIKRKDAREGGSRTRGRMRKAA
jgi:hypothetical protein